MTVEEQLLQWVAGNSIHNDERGECCPDFSCCQPEIKADLETRKRFAQAYREQDEETKMSMLGVFLGKAIANYTEKTGKKVYLAGVDNPEIPTQ